MAKLVHSVDRNKMKSLSNITYKDRLKMDWWPTGNVYKCDRKKYGRKSLLPKSGWEVLNTTLKAQTKIII